MITCNIIMIAIGNSVIISFSDYIRITL